MARYHFHTGADNAHLDPDGIELKDIRAAQSEAIKSLGQMVSDDSEEFWSEGLFRMTVADDRGLTLFTLELSAQIALAGRAR